jgi:hypothetical protein
MATKRSAKTIDEVRASMHEALAIDPGMDGVDLRVFLYLSYKLNFETFTEVPRLEIASTLGRRKEHISRAMSKLKDKGVLIDGRKVGGRFVEWRLSRDFGK